jgi:hypothetical protein
VNEKIEKYGLMLDVSDGYPVKVRVATLWQLNTNASYVAGTNSPANRHIIALVDIGNTGYGGMK